MGRGGKRHGQGMDGSRRMMDDGKGVTSITPCTDVVGQSSARARVDKEGSVAGLGEQARPPAGANRMACRPARRRPRPASAAGPPEPAQHLRQVSADSDWSEYSK